MEVELLALQQMETLLDLVYKTWKHLHQVILGDRSESQLQQEVGEEQLGLPQQECIPCWCYQSERRWLEHADRDSQSTWNH